MNIVSLPRLLRTPQVRYFRDNALAVHLNTIETNLQHDIFCLQVPVHEIIPMHVAEALQCLE